jgi:hypothetical protein
MSVVTEEMVEAAACRIALHVGCGDPSDFRDCNPKTCDCRAAASDALAAVAPIIAKAERERCIAIAHKWSRDGQSPTALGIIIGIEGDET